MTNEEFIKSVSLEGEIWKDVVGYESYYMVSSLGRVISLSRSIANRYSMRCTNPKLLNPYTRYVSSNYRFYCVSLWKDNKCKSCRVHRLVAIAFIPNPDNLKEIDHIDTNTANNRVDNLRWCNRVTNANNPLTLSKNREIRLEKPIPKLQKPIAQLLNGELISIFPSIKSTTSLGFNKNTISLCCNNRRHSHKGFQWMFLSDYESLINMSKNS